MKILDIEILNNIMEVYTLWLEYMELKECEQTLIMFLQDVNKSNNWQWKPCYMFEIRVSQYIVSGYCKYVLCFTGGYNEIGINIADINLKNIKQQLKEYECSRTNL